MLGQLIYECYISAQDGDTSTGSDLPHELEEENIRSRKTKGKEPTSSRTMNRRTRRPSQFKIKEVVTDNQDAD